MKISKDFKKLTDQKRWELISEYISESGEFYSIRGVKYTAKLGDNKIIYTGNTKGTRRSIQEEILHKGDVLSAIRAIEDKENINTSTIKHFVKQIYRQRSPFIGLLKSADILK